MKNIGKFLFLILFFGVVGVASAGDFRDGMRAFSKGDFATALGFLERGCEGTEVAKSCALLGIMHNEGKGVKEDAVRASGLFEKSCAAGESWSCVMLGGMYADGRGVSKNAKKAAEFYQKGCDGEFALGCVFAGQIYFEGRGVQKDVGRAEAVYKRACEMGEKLGCEALKAVATKR